MCMERLLTALAVAAATIALLAVAGGFVGLMTYAARHDAEHYARLAAQRTAHQTAVAACLRTADDYSQASLTHCDLTAR